MKKLAPTLICLLLAACGGGGGGGSTGGNTGGGTGTTPPVTTTGNLVAGIIVGLEASGLVIANGSDIVKVPKAGTSFVFANRLTAGTTYTAAITSQPLGFQSCNINGTFPATMPSADVSLVVNCGDAVVGVSTLAGTDTAGSINGSGSDARFSGIFGLALDAAGNIYVGDARNGQIRKITVDGVVTTFAGGSSTNFVTPSALVFDSVGNLYFTDAGAHNVRRISTTGVITTIAGSGTFASNDGNGVLASFKTPGGIVIDSNNNIFVGDAEAHVIRKISPAGDVTTFAGTTNVKGSADGTGTAASFNDPSGLAIDAANNLYVADALNNKIRKITPAGVVTTFAGSGAAGSVNGTGTAATFNLPVNLSIDTEGFLYVAESQGNLIRKISPSGKVTTVAGGGTGGDTADTGGGAAFHGPTSVVFDKSKTLYVADGNKVRKLVRK